MWTKPLAVRFLSLKLAPSSFKDVQTRQSMHFSYSFIYLWIFCPCRNLAAIQDREICCYSISCKEKDNIGKFQTITALFSPLRHDTDFCHLTSHILVHYCHLLMSDIIATSWSVDSANITLSVIRCIHNSLNDPACILYFRHHTSVAHPALKISKKLKKQELFPQCVCHVTVITLWSVVSAHMLLCTALFTNSIFPFMPCDSPLTVHYWKCTSGTKPKESKWHYSLWSFNLKDKPTVMFNLPSTLQAWPGWLYPVIK